MSKQDELEMQFESHLDDEHGQIVIAGIEYSASQILRTLDPVAYEIAVREYAENN